MSVTCCPYDYCFCVYYNLKVIKADKGGAIDQSIILLLNQKLIREEQYRLNLSRYCDKANLVYTPKKGAALFWYNHMIDDDTGWLGRLDELSFHGGCDVIQGVKWAANNWINASNDRKADLAVWENF